MATQRHTCCRALRALADGAAHSGAPSYSRAPGDGGLDRSTDLCRRYAQRSALAPPAAYDAVDQPAWQFHVRPGNDRAHSVRGTLACVTIGATGCCAAVVEFRAPCLSRSLPEILMDQK